MSIDNSFYLFCIRNRVRSFLTYWKRRYAHLVTWKRRKSLIAPCQSIIIQHYELWRCLNKQQIRHKIKDLSGSLVFYLAVVFCLFTCWHSQTFLTTMIDLHTLILIWWLRLRNSIAHYSSQKRKGTKHYFISDSPRHLVLG